METFQFIMNIVEIVFYSFVIVFIVRRWKK
nr:MAG TPA: hypothetical protein [Caudoviricetes sp.]